MRLFGRLSASSAGGALSVIVTWLSIVTTAIARVQGHEQVPLAFKHEDAAADSKRFSVGFSIQSSYGSAAVVVESPDGSTETHSFVQYGNKDYRNVMARLSLASSQHLAPPYQDMGQYFEDQPRRIQRDLRKKLGLPASSEVGTIANVLKELRKKIEAQFEFTVSEAVFATAHLLALYEDDLNDLADYLDIKYVIPHRQYQLLLWETGAAFAGYGQGLCEHWQNKQKCFDEIGKMPDIPVLAVHYSRNALTVSLAQILDPVGLIEPDWRHDENFTLGSDAIENYSSVDDYWHDVADLLTYTMRFFPLFEKPSKIIITGDKADQKFMGVVKDTLIDFMGRLPEVFDDNAVTAAADGAAELMRRTKAPW